MTRTFPQLHAPLPLLLQRELLIDVVLAVAAPVWQGCRSDVVVWQRILSVRSLILSPR